MKQEINPKDTSRAIAFEVWTKSPMPMVTFTKTFDVTRLRKLSRKRGMKFNMLPISFQFHHAQMDGKHAARFLEELQKIINTI